RITRSSRVMTVRKANRVMTVNGNRHCKKPNGKIKRSVLPAEPRLHMLERIHHTVGRRTPARLNSGIQSRPQGIFVLFKSSPPFAFPRRHQISRRPVGFL